MQTVIDALEEREFIDAMTSEELRKKVTKPCRVYCGFDPTADSLHIGNLVALMGLAWFRRFGHTPVVLIGGATGMIGDPSGKSSERNLLDETTLHNNVAGIEENLRRFFSHTEGETTPLFLNNYDWFKSFPLIDYLRDVGKHFRLGPMLGKESVRTRMENEEGMSFTEFSYQTLQGYDFLYLWDHHSVTVQIGGSDQWGNITAGTDLIRKLRGAAADGLSFPLLVRSDGKKFGKTEEGAVFLSPKRVSPYAFYQYFYRIPDSDVIRLLKVLTFLPMEEIRSWERAMKEPDYSTNSAQQKLAEEVTRNIHGPEGVAEALAATAAARPGGETRLEAKELEAIRDTLPHCAVRREEVVGQKIVDVLAAQNVVKSKGDVRRLVKNGGLYLNNIRLTDESRLLSLDDLIGEKFLLFALGKKNKVLLFIEA